MPFVIKSGIEIIRESNELEIELDSGFKFEFVNELVY